MAQPYIGEIRMFAGTFAPLGWEFCQGQELSIAENEALFTLIGTTYGGDGQTNFALPNLSSRIPIHMGNGPDGLNYPISQMAGTEQETLTTQQIPVHTHAMLGSTDPASSQAPAANVVAKSTQVDLFINAVPTDTMNMGAITPVGGSQPHENVQPFLCINYIISLFGIFPSQT
ncbi:MAG TPA: tail fiber protein [Abditibacteriaceae bacterium]|jgi:microcystin-dependent protein